MSTPTQVAFPWKATLRTVIAGMIGAGIVVPLVLAIVQQYLGVYISPQIMGGIIWGSGLLVAISGAVTKIMAIPAVNAWLTKYLGLGAAPKS
jgi:ABC-type phosphate transport system permease subunit